MKRLAVIAAVIAFFGLAIVGSLCGVRSFVCATRALVGAGVVFVMVRIAGGVFVSVMVKSIVRDSSATRNSQEQSSESANQ